ncbi:MAG: hypothetical protein KKB39_00285 [Nanoarchaeota archaeon]|nr:hypothetical protein [Nanoarchaeota archaeon]
MSLRDKIKNFIGLEYCKHPKSNLYLGFGISTCFLGLSLLPEFQYLDLACYSALGLGIIQSSNEKSKELIEKDREYWNNLFEDAEFLEWKRTASDEEIIEEWQKYL